jgi:outer membrane lipoprotein SlyB
MNDRARNWNDQSGIFIAVGSGIGMAIGVAIAAGPGLALGAALGAAAGVVIGSGYQAIRRS